MRVLSLLFIYLLPCWSATTELEQKVLDAFQEAQNTVAEQQLNEKTIKEDGHSPQTQKANGDSQLEQIRGDLLAETTKILLAKNGPDILPKLETIDTDKIFMASSLKPPHKKRFANSSPSNDPTCGLDSNCFSTKNTYYRSISGICNNKMFANFGKAVTPLRRFLGKGSYADNVGKVRTKSVTGSQLPSARQISNTIHTIDDENPKNDPKASHLHMQYGQFIAHDIIFIPSSTGANGETLDCSTCNSSSVTPNCAPIRVPSDDNYFPKKGCIRLTRALNGQKGLGQRQTLNQNTHLLDLSAVYGSDDCTAKKLRSATIPGGLAEQPFNKKVLPPRDPTDKNCLSTAPNYCFLCGDFRNSLQPGLIPLHTMYIELHNKYAKEIKKVRSDLSDEQIYQEVRRVVIARYQNNVMSEYLPQLLSSEIMEKYDLDTPGSYDTTLKPALTVEFAAGAFRFGHSQARNDLPRQTYNNITYSPIDLGSNFFYSDSLYDKMPLGGTEAMLNGMMYNPARKVDRCASFPIRNQLFEKRNEKASGIDLIATNIQRGRDTGIFPYNEYRSRVGLQRAANFSDKNLRKTIENKAVDNYLKKVYASVDDIDFYTGMLLENHLPGGMIGPTGANIIAETFRALRNGDRFFFDHKNNHENSRAFSDKELAQIKGSSLASLICEVSPTIETIPSRPLQIGSKIVPCKRIKSTYNMTYWATYIPRLKM